MMHRPNSTFQSNLPAMSQSLSVTNHHMYSNPSMVTINHSHQSSLLQQQHQQQQQQQMQQQAAIHQAQLHQRANLQNIHHYENNFQNLGYNNNQQSHQWNTTPAATAA